MIASAHTQYIDALVPWLGAVPAHWSVAPVWTLFRRSKRTGHANEPLLSVYRDHGVVFKDSRDDNANRASEDLSTYQLVEPGDLVINKMKAWQGSVAVSQLRGIVSPAYFVFRPTHNHDPRFLHLLLRSRDYITGYKAISKGIRVAQWDLDPEKHRVMPVLIPSPTEQALIVAFLDRETTRIGSLIEKKARFIELLCEKQVATITRVVVNGLRPGETKQSMVPWIPASPAHWTVLPLSAVATRGGGLFIDGDWIESKDLADEGVRYITTGNVGRGIYKEKGSGFISEDTFRRLNCTEVLAGDILVSRLNSPIARACVVPDLNSRVVTSVDNVIVRPSPAYDRRFLVYLFSSAPHFYNTENLARGTTMQRISRSALGRIRFAVPNLAEQVEIADHLDHEIGKLQRLIAKTERSIELLKEHRSALIAAAVTGKIDVRGQAAKNMKAAA